MSNCLSKIQHLAAFSVILPIKLTQHVSCVRENAQVIYDAFST